MSKIQIFTDTGADMTDELEKEGVTIVPLYITFDGTKYLKQMVDIKLPEFYDRMRKPHDIHPKTSLASIQDYVDLFKEALDAGKDVLYIVMNGNFSSTMGAAMNAKNILSDDYPERRIEVVDSKLVTYGQYYLAHLANKMANEGKDIDKIIEVINEVKEETKFYFTVETLDYLKDGGRIGSATALLGGVLNIKPVLFIEDGAIFPISKVRGRNKSLQSVTEEVKKFLEGKNVDDYDFAILEGDVYEEADEFRKEFEKEVGTSNLPMCKLGISIGLHAGPGTIGIAVVKKTKKI